ncbi:uncharacterized protein LOC113159254 [Anabas testudineus]|uniref:uncharacterized protein LOC113159254 n=1 Tax=Anabas testudineus TaxID=64144 RepID=UPI000E4544F7|nr:uncharacterized protein LOC113159254 [Anabas testudineus]
MDHSRGLRPYYGDSAKQQYARSPKLLRDRSGNEFLGLSRCAACYNHNANSKRWHGANGESSSSAEDSESEVDCESEAESSSSSSYSGHVVAVPAAPEKAETDRISPVCENASECVREDGDEQKGNASQSQEDKIRANGMTRRAPLVKSFSLPSSFTPHLTPFSLLPRPPRIVSTLHLQVLPEEHDNDTFFTIRQNLLGREHENTAPSQEGEGRTYNLLPPQPFQWQQMGLPWQQMSQLALQQNQYQQQQQMSYQYQYQQQLPQHFPPLSAQVQMLPPPPLPVLHPPAMLQPQHVPQSHLHAVTSQPCCYPMQFPFTYWSHYSSGELPRW